MKKLQKRKRCEDGEGDDNIKQIRFNCPAIAKNDTSNRSGILGSR